MAIDEEELYQDHILDHYEDPYHRGHCPRCTHAHQDDNPLCGDVVRMELQIDDAGTLREVYFDGDGCCISQAAASMIVEKFDGQHGRGGQEVHRQRHAGPVRRPAHAQPAEVLPAALAGVAGGHLLARVPRFECQWLRQCRASQDNPTHDRARTVETPPLDPEAFRADFPSSAARSARACRWSISTTPPARSVRTQVIQSIVELLRRALRQRPSRHPPAGPGVGRTVRRGPGKRPRASSTPPTAEQCIFTYGHDLGHQPRGAELGRREHPPGRRDPAHRDGASLEPRPLAAAWPSARGAVLRHIPLDRRRPACSWTRSTSC